MQFRNRPRPRSVQSSTYWQCFQVNRTRIRLQCGQRWVPALRFSPFPKQKLVLALFCCRKPICNVQQSHLSRPFWLLSVEHFEHENAVCPSTCRVSPLPACLSVSPGKIINYIQIFSLLRLPTPRLTISLQCAHVHLHQSGHQPASQANQVPEQSPIRKIIPRRRSSEYGVANICPAAFGTHFGTQRRARLLFQNALAPVIWSDSFSVSVHFTAMLVFPVRTLSILTDLFVRRPLFVLCVLRWK